MPSFPGNPNTPEEMTGLFAGVSDRLDENTVSLLYLYYFSTTEGSASWTLSVDELYGFLSGSVLSDPRFSGFIDADPRDEINAMKAEIDAGVQQLIGPDYSRMILTVALQDGSDASTDFMRTLSAESDDAFNGNYYFIGNAPMVYEMSRTFGDDYLLITILTAIAIFLVVAITFRSFVIPLILVMIIQGGVYLTVSLSGLQGNSIFYLALLIVQCILMGATIDYGILLTSYYKEARNTKDRGEAIIAAYNGSIHTILTSGLIMMLVTGIVGYAFENPTIGQICQIISMGALSAMLLIVFILPGVLAAFDRLICKEEHTARFLKRQFVKRAAEDSEA